MKFNEGFLEKIGEAGAGPDTGLSFDETNADKDYGENRRRHRLFIQRLDHLIEVVSHHGFLFLVTAGTVVFSLVVFLATRYIGICRQSELLLTISNDFFRVLTYAGTVFITHIITKFLENRKK